MTEVYRDRAADDARTTCPLHDRGRRVRKRRLFPICDATDPAAQDGMLGVLETQPDGCVRVYVYRHGGTALIASTHPDRLWDVSEWTTPRAAYRWAMTRYRPGASHAPTEVR